MPTYQYACTTGECGHRFELVQSFTDPSASECPTCGGPVRKVFSTVGVVFKGSGFYRTDSRAGAKSGTGKSGAGRSEAGKSEGAAASSGGSSTEGSASSSDTSSTSSSGAAAGASGSTAKAAASA